MELLVFVLIAVVAGYLLARSRISKPIDQSAQKVAETTQKAAKSTGGWFSRAGGWVKKTLHLDKKPKDEVVDAAEAKPTEPVEAAAPAAAAPAAKQPSRRKDEETKPE